MKMNDVADQIERDRRRREDRLLILLLSIADEARRDSMVAVKHGLSTQTVLVNTFAKAGPEISAAMADAHADAFKRFGKLSGRSMPEFTTADLASLALLYDDHAHQAVQAMQRTLDQAITSARQDDQMASAKSLVQTAFDTSGYTRSHSFALDSGAERAVVTASNVGMIAAAFSSEEVAGLEHVSVVDDRTTDICLARDGVRCRLTIHFGNSTLPPCIGRAVPC